MKINLFIYFIIVGVIVALKIIWSRYHKPSVKKKILSLTKTLQRQQQIAQQVEEEIKRLRKELEK